MAAHSSNLAWKIPWTEKPRGLPSMGSQRVRHRLSTHTHNAHSSTVYSSQVMEANHVSINRQTDKEAMVFIYTGIFLSHEKELNSLICSNVDGPREYYA